MISKTEGLTVEEALQKAGGWGRFQTILTVIMILTINSCNMVTFGLVYAELDPQYSCKFNSNPNIQVTCTYD